MDMARITQLCIFLVCIYGAGLIFSYLQGLIMATVTQKNSRNLRTPSPKRSTACPSAILTPIRSATCSRA